MFHSRFCLNNETYQSWHNECQYKHYPFHDNTVFKVLGANLEGNAHYRQTFLYAKSTHFHFLAYFSIFSTAMYRKIRVILLLYITKIKKYYKTKRGHIKIDMPSHKSFFFIFTISLGCFRRNATNTRTDSQNPNIGLMLRLLQVFRHCYNQNKLPYVWFFVHPRL